MNKIDQLIAKYCPNGVEFVELGKCVKTMTTGKLNANAKVENGQYPFFTCDANFFRINSYAFDTEAIIISGNGSQVGHINYYKGKFNAYQRTYVISDCIYELSIHFLLFYLKAYLKDYIVQNSKKASIPYITMPILQKFIIPIPPIIIQQKIVAILDKFDSLVNDLSSGLPAEIKARTKQYEYYREKLLSFI